MNASLPVPSHYSAFYETSSLATRRPLPTVACSSPVRRVQEHNSSNRALPPTMADLAQAASCQASYYDIAASAASLSYLASKAQSVPLTREEWDQFTTTTEQLRRAFVSLHGQPGSSRSSSPTNDCVSAMSRSSSSYSSTTTTTTPVTPGSSFSGYPSSPLSSPCPSPSPPVQRSHFCFAGDEPLARPQLGWAAMGVERKPRSRNHKMCAHCGTSESSQWRRGPFDKAMLCNACGLRYSRNFAKKRQQKDDRQQLVDEARQSDSSYVPATPASGGTRSDIYDLLN